MDKEQHQSTPTPEEIWEILHTISARQEKFDREFEKQRSETDRRLKDTDHWLEETKKLVRETSEQMKDTDRRMKDTDRRMKETGERIFGQWGILMESLVEGDLVPLLQAEGINVRTTHTRVNGRLNGEHYEYDILAVNDGKVVVVEVKTTLRPEEVKRFVEKLGRFTSHLREYRGWQVYGAMAYLTAHESVIKHVERQGLFVIRAVGSSASIINGAGFQPRVFV